MGYGHRKGLGNTIPGQANGREKDTTSRQQTNKEKKHASSTHFEIMSCDSIDFLSPL
jgi:hypothetical protein